MLFAPAILSFALAAPPPAPKPADDGAVLYRAVVRAGRGVRQTEFAQMFAAVLSGSMMGPGDGWFKPSQARYDWKWLAARYDLDHDGKITRKEFPGPQELFLRLDRDRDGVLTAADLDWSDKAPFFRQLSQATQLLANLDSDDDRRLTKQEWDALFKKFAQGKDYLNADDLRAMMYPPPPPAPPSKGPSASASSGMPTKAILLKGLLAGELGSPCEGPRIGDPAPEFTLTDLDGKNVSLSQFRGNKPLVLIFGSFT